MNELLSWLCKSDAYDSDTKRNVCDVLQIVKTESAGWGLALAPDAARLEPGTLLVSIAPDYLLNISHWSIRDLPNVVRWRAALSSELDAAAEEDEEDEEALLALALIGAMRDPSHHFAPYCRMLALCVDPHLVAKWRLESEHKLAERHRAHGGAFDVSLDEWAFAMAAVRSRAHWIANRATLVPYGDLFNHQRGERVAFGDCAEVAARLRSLSLAADLSAVADEQSFVAVATHPLEPGAEVFISYVPDDESQEQLLEWGILPEPVDNC